VPEVLLDSSTYIDLERASRHRREAWAGKTLRHALAYRASEGNPFLSVITVAEILKGLYKDVDPSKAQAFIHKAALGFGIIDVNVEIACLAAEIMAKLEKSGQNIGFADCLIAGIAVHKKLVLVTSNGRHFGRVIDLGYELQIVNWRESLD